MTNEIYFSESYRIYFQERNSETAYLNNFPDLVFRKKQGLVFSSDEAASFSNGIKISVP